MNTPLSMRVILLLPSGKYDVYDVALLGALILLIYALNDLELLDRLDELLNGNAYIKPRPFSRSLIYGPNLLY